MPPNVIGNMKGVSLSAMLQVYEKEKATCVLGVSANKRTGRLYLSAGELIAAEVGSLTRESAAFEMIGWDKVDITIESDTVDKKRDIRMPLMMLVLEANRLKDERKSRKAGGAPSAKGVSGAAGKPEKKAAADAPAKPVKKSSAGKTPGVRTRTKSTKPGQPKAAGSSAQAVDKKPEETPDLELMLELDADPAPAPKKPHSRPVPELELELMLEEDTDPTPSSKPALHKPDPEPDTEPEPDPEPEIELTFEVDTDQTPGFDEPEIELTPEADADGDGDGDMELDFGDEPDPPPPPTPKKEARPKKQKQPATTKATRPTQNVEEKASPPLADAPSDDPFPADPQATEDPPHPNGDPNGTVTDLSADIRKLVKETKGKKRKRFLLVTGLAVTIALLLLGAVLAWITLVQPRRSQSAYQRMITSLESQPNLSVREKALQNFVDANPDSSFSRDAGNLIAELRHRMHDEEYHETMARVEGLPLDGDYARDARNAYNNFLNRHPESEHATEIRQRIARIPEVIEDYEFEALGELEPRDHEKRLAAYRTYLANHPEGKHREQLKRMVLSLGEEYYILLEKSAGVCNREQGWGSCIRMCEWFLNGLKDHPRAPDVARLKTSLNDNRDMAGLILDEQKAADDPRARIDLFQNYLNANPESTVRSDVEARLRAAERDMAAILEWQNLLRAAKDRSIDVFKRIRDIEDFLRRRPHMENDNETREVMALLEKERQAALRQRGREEERRRREAELQERRKQEQARIDTLRKGTAARLARTDGRFVDNGDGTVTDTRTRLTWTMLDSRHMLRKCLDHQAARQYVGELKTGGRGDWRLPNANELVILFKNEPFYPLPDAAEWYWTSQVYARGYQEVADIVTSRPETVWSRANRDIYQCGAVMAVRP